MQLATDTLRPQYEFPKLPYAMDALEPFISSETLGFHYGKHHRGYVNKLNALIQESEFVDAPLEEIVRKSSGRLFNNAAQVWNHSFYWKCMSPYGGGVPSGNLGRGMTRAFGSFESFKHFFKQTAVEQFGAGWTWLIKTRDGRLLVRETSNAANPLLTGEKALLVCDVWEHAYYLDYRNDRARYINAFLNVVDWRFVEEKFME